MVSLHSDKVTFWTGISGTVFLLLSASYFVAKGSDRPVACWTPAHFMEAHTEYTNALCEYEEHRRPPVPPQLLPEKNQSSEQVKGESNDSYKNFCSLSHYAIQAILLCISYHVLSSITTSVSPAARLYKNQHAMKSSESKEHLVAFTAVGHEVGVASGTSCTIMMSYILTQAITSILLIASGLKSVTQYTPIHSSEMNHTFLCDFEIRHLASVHRYTVQCVEDDPSGGILSVMEQATPCLNSVLCLVLVVMITVHLVTMMCCGGCVKRWILTGRLGATDGRAPEYFSDATLVAAVANDMK